MLKKGVRIAACAVCMLFPPVASAVPAWLAPQDLSAIGQDANAAEVAFDGAGNALAVWSRSNGSNYIVQASARPAGGAWSSPQDLSATGQNAHGPQVAVDGAGNAVVVWRRFDGSDDIVQASARPAGGAWSSPQDLSAAGENANGQWVSIGGNGSAVAAWRRFDGSNYIVQAAVRSPTSGIWSSPQDLSAAGEDAGGQQVALDGSGNALATWSRFDGSDFIAQASLRSPTSGIWSSPQDLSATGEHTTVPQLALDGSGNAIALWSRVGTVQASERPTGGTWSSPDDLFDGSGPRVALDGAGNAVVVWEKSNGTHAIVQATERPAGGLWSSPEDLSAVGQSAFFPQVALDGSGNALAAWYRSNGAHNIVQAAARPAGGEWDSPDDLSAAGQNASVPQVTFDAAGNALAIWSRGGIVQAAPYDGAGPILRGLSVPASASTGAPVAFSVDAFDSWSALASPSWNFGDGAAASGANVSHTYAAAGTYTVSVNQADALGNASSATRQIVVSAPPPAPAALPALTISNAKMKEGNRGTKAMTFLVRLSSASATPVTVGFKTQKGTAKPRSDFVGRSGVLTIAPGQTQFKLVVKIKGDLRDERNEKFKVLLANAVGATIADAEGVGTIRDNDP